MFAKQIYLIVCEEVIPHTRDLFYRFIQLKETDVLSIGHHWFLLYKAIPNKLCIFFEQYMNSLLLHKFGFSLFLHMNNVKIMFLYAVVFTWNNSHHDAKKHLMVPKMSTLTEQIICYRNIFSQKYLKHNEYDLLLLQRNVIDIRDKKHCLFGEAIVILNHSTLRYA